MGSKETSETTSTDAISTTEATTLKSNTLVTTDASIATTSTNTATITTTSTSSTPAPMKDVDTVTPSVACTSGCGLNILVLNDKNTFELDEVALERILMRDDIKDLPVVVVSVAGAYRGGKSFLLDFFLRYLNAPVSARTEVDAWLGDENKPLTGFSWRGGSMRHTTGIVMWSEPFVCKLPTGEKVVVLLLDTQGTFDSTSTMRDSSTIFAFSTLLASVQIFNLSSKIKEDDLQHLQLFTEYSKLVQEEKEKTFQTLKFLIRDWQFPYEYPYGSEGGKKVLEKWLSITDDLQPEMRELRQHIHSTFENIDCFLMPHPGFNVFKPTFDGRLSDISSEFKTALLELVPSVFAPSKLIPKVIKGTRVTAHDLFVYIKSYMKIFASDDIPSPRSIMEATSEAAMLSAVRKAKALYESTMEQNCGLRQPSWPRAALAEAHDSAVKASCAAFLSSKKLATADESKPYLARLTQDLEARLPELLLINEGKTMKAIDEAKTKYAACISAVHGRNMLCLHPTDLKIIHSEAVLEATRVFDAQRKQFLDIQDEEKLTLLHGLDKELEHLQSTNDINNRTVVSDVVNEYSSAMGDLNAKEVSEETFLAEHNKGLIKAYETLRQKRNRQSHYSDDIYKSNMTIQILEIYSTMNIKNTEINERHLHDAIIHYENTMYSFWYRGTQCLHPDDLESAHENAKQQALLILHPDQNLYIYDSRKESLLQNIDSMYSRWEHKNEIANNRASNDAFRVYYNGMKNDCSFNGWWILVIPMIIQKSKKNTYHENNKRAAKREFRRRRRYGNTEGNDPFYYNLINRIENAFYDF